MGRRLRVHLHAPVCQALCFVQGHVLGSQPQRSWPRGVWIYGRALLYLERFSLEFSINMMTILEACLATNG